jgi:cytochrome d ubiquinol oxidase subunit II
MEPLWSPVVATGGNQRQLDGAPKPQKQAKTVAVDCHRLPATFHGRRLPQRRAARLGERELEARFRERALGAGVIAGAIALAGLAVLRSDASPLYQRLVEGRALPALVVSVLAGLATLALVWWRRYEPARYSSALAVAAIVAGWALAQAPTLLRGLTIEQAAASHDTLVAVIVAVVAGAVILFPSLALLFGLVLRGGLDHARTATRPVPAGRMLVAASTPGLLARLAGACLVAGIGFTTIANAGWAHAIGVASLLAFIALGFPAALPPEIVTSRQGEGSTERC